MKQGKIASKTELIIYQAALQTTQAFLKEHQIAEKSETGQLFAKLQDEITKNIIAVLPDPDSE